MRRALAALAACLLSAPALAAPPPTLKPIKLALSDDGQAFVRFLTWHQLWVRGAQLNPGTTVQDTPTDEQIDFGLRRSRYLIWGELGRVQLIAHFGMNNQTFANGRKPQLYVHDAWASVEVIERHLTVGTGLHYWHGVSRLTNASTLNLLTLDAPILNWPTIERTDQFARHLGLFAKGQVGPIDYRLALNQPFATDRPLTAGGPADYRAGNPDLSYAAYVQWFLLEPEANTLPYAVGTYLGTKRVLNLGLGVQYAPDAMASQDTQGNARRHDLLLLGADVFLDHPVGEGAVTAYAAYYHYDFGPRHLRTIGIMNPGAGGTTFNGGGNAYPVIGTGEHGYLQVGYLLPGDAMLQPYLDVQASFMDALADPLLVLGAGANWYLHGQHAKLTLHYRARPIVAAGPAEPTWDGTLKSEVILQLHVRL